MLSSPLFLLPLMLSQAQPDTHSLVQEAVINASAHKIYEAFSTREGWKLLGVAQADVDFRIGGLAKTHYSPEGKIGDKNTIVNQFLAYDPDRMVAFKIYQAPEKFPFKKAAKSVWTVVYLEPLESTKTKVTVKMLGYGDDDESQKMRAFFEKGNKVTMDVLREKMEGSSAKALEK